ncbi:MAG: hypothetical protein ACXVRU_13595 [Gaiellaceae bacterium]
MLLGVVVAFVLVSVLVPPGLLLVGASSRRSNASGIVGPLLMAGFAVTAASSSWGRENFGHEMTPVMAFTIGIPLAFAGWALGVALALTLSSARRRRH